MSYIDCHSHLDDPQFSSDLDNVISNYISNNIRFVIVVSMDYDSILNIRKLAESYKSILESAGLHPVSFAKSQNKEKDLSQVIEYINLNHNRLFCIGEVGLDFSPWLINNENDKDIQIKMFTDQINLAIKYNLPLNVHSRNAGHYAVELLIDKIPIDSNIGVCMHAFDGKAKYALAALKKSNFYFSIPPSCLRDDATKKLLASLPIDRILLESDSPALSHIKNERNVPSNILQIVKYISEVKKLPINEITDILWSNSLKCFATINQRL